MLLFAVVLALAVFAFVRFVDHGGPRHAGPPPYPPSPPSPPSPSDQAVAQARLRYANGQLSREEYFRILADLGAAPPGPSGPPPWWPPAPDAPAGMWSRPGEPPVGL